jgi:hypothetical protein
MLLLELVTKAFEREWKVTELWRIIFLAYSLNGVGLIDVEFEL